MSAGTRFQVVKKLSINDAIEIITVTNVFAEMAWLDVPLWVLQLPKSDFLCYISGLYLTFYVGVKKKEKEHFYQTGMSHELIHVRL